MTAAQIKEFFLRTSGSAFGYQGRAAQRCQEVPVKAGSQCEKAEIGVLFFMEPVKSRAAA